MVKCYGVSYSPLFVKLSIVHRLTLCVSGFLILYNMCEVHWGLCNALGYSVQWSLFSALGGYHDCNMGVQCVRGYHDCNWGFSMHWWDIVNASQGVQCIGEISVLSQNTPSALMVSPHTIMISPNALMISPQCI